MRSERKNPEPAGSQDDPDKDLGRGSQENPEQEADSGEAGQAQRKPFDNPLPNIDPLPGEPPKWWNP